MKQFFLVLASTILSGATFSQNVGVGTAAPTEKLDVNGNMNLAGQLKLNGNQGASSQVLGKDASNNLSWIDVSGYRNFTYVDCYNIEDPCAPTNWVVPAGVTTVVLECWGGGGGGSSMSGGSSGGFVLAKLTVTPGQTLVITPGFGGTRSLAGGIAGGNSTVTATGISITAGGGDGGRSGNVSTTGQSYSPPVGATATATGANLQFIPRQGNSGLMTNISFVQSSGSVFGRKIHYGGGGDAPHLPGSGGVGGYVITSNDFTQFIQAAPVAVQGAGGGGDNSGGANGRGGRVIIHW